MKLFLAVFVGGGLGSLLRYVLQLAWSGRAGEWAFPWSTFGINVLGSFCIGTVRRAGLPALPAGRGPAVSRHGAVRWLHDVLHLQQRGVGFAPARAVWLVLGLCRGQSRAWACRCFCGLLGGRLRTRALSPYVCRRRFLLPGRPVGLRRRLGKEGCRSQWAGCGTLLPSSARRSVQRAA